MDILTKIVTRTREIVEERSKLVSLADLRAKLADMDHATHSLRARMNEARPHVIAEFKRRSPSKPSINPDANPVQIAENYEAGGASAMSVLTEPDFFGGAPQDLRAIRQSVKMPLLRKDFMVNPYQFYEAREMGADMVLLIARCLKREELAEYTFLAQELGMEVLCEIHGVDELEIVADAPIDFLGVNCRDLKKFETDIERLIDIAPQLPKDIPLVAESGIHNREDLWRLYDNGYSLFLIGEYLMRSASPQVALQELLRP